MSRNSVKSDMVSGFDSAAAFFKAIAEEVQNLGGGDEDLRKVLSESCLDLKRKIAELIVDDSKVKITEEEARRRKYCSNYPYAKAFHAFVDGRDESVQFSGSSINSVVLSFVSSCRHLMMDRKELLSIKDKIELYDWIQEIELLLTKFNTKEASTAGFQKTELAWLDDIKLSLKADNYPDVLRFVQQFWGYYIGLTKHNRILLGESI